MLLVGSKALQTYMHVPRIIHDWDIWMSNDDFHQFMVKNNQFLVKRTPHTALFDIDGVIVEIKREAQFEPTDQKIWDLTMTNPHCNTIGTPWGVCRVPNIDIIYDMKCATAMCMDEWKHHFDKKLIEEGYPCSILENSDLYKERLAETQERLAKSKKKKYEFFHRTQHENTAIATIPEYITHDKLHTLIADLCGIRVPTYIRIINGDVKVEKELFDRLTHLQKLQLMVEESLVLALERWFIPQMVENGINYKLIERFHSNNEASPTYKLLQHVNIKGLKGEEPYITQFGRDNFADIEKLWVLFKHELRGNGFPKWFLDEIFVLREKYRKGEKVGIHHDRY